MQNSPESLDRKRFLRAVAALACLLPALVLLPVLVGRLKSARLPEIDRPAIAYSEWIQPGSTNQPLLLNLRVTQFWQTTIRAVDVETSFPGEVKLSTEAVLSLTAPETPLLEPTPVQLGSPP